MLTRVQKGSNIYAVYELDASQPQIDKISFMMINSNQQHNIGLAPITFEEMNGVYYKMLFDVTGKVTLREYIGKHISQEDFRQMLLNLIDTIEQFDEYMIDVNQILLDMDCVYINVVDHSIAFLCIALKGVTQVYRPYEFFRAVVQNSYVNLNINEVSYFNHIWNITSDENGFSLSNMKAAMQTSQETRTKSKPQEKTPLLQHSVTDTPRIEEPKEITISQPRYTPPPVVPVPDSEQEEQKNGFLSRFFPTSKKKKTTSLGYQGGLAGFKNGIGRAGNSAVHENKESYDSAVSLQQRLMEQNSPVNQPEAQHPATYQRTAYQGTTVLKGKMPEYAPQFTASVQQESIPASIGTTVLNKKMQDNIEIGASVPQKSTPAIPETAVLKVKMPNYAPEVPARAYQENVSAPPGTTVLKGKMQMFEPPVPETTVLKGKGGYPPETTVLKKTACLIRLRNHDRFFINKLEFSIGRGASEIDCAVNDNTNVSRQHANIVQYGVEYFLVVITKTNETYLNEARLEQGAEIKLSDGDKIRLADEEFEFRIV